MKQLTLLLWGFLIVTLTTGCFGRLIYTSDTYRGKVIDAESKEPLVGAVVLAIWYREAPGLGHPAEGYYDALEVLTDAQGEFTVPAKTHVTTFGKIREPQLVIYYPGYGYYNGFQVRPTDKEVRAAYEQRFFHVELRQWKNREEQIRNVPSIGVSRVPEAKMPNLSRLVNEELQTLGLQPIRLGR